MKRIILLPIIIIFCIACEEQVDIEKEKEAIKKVLLDEGNFFAENDSVNLFALHVQDSTDTRLAGTNLIKGWDNIKSLLNRYIEYNSNDTSLQNFYNEKDNLIIKVNGKSAWAIMDNTWFMERNDKTTSFSNYQISFLEKIKGNWKFSFNAFVSNKPNE